MSEHDMDGYEQLMIGKVQAENDSLKALLREVRDVFACHADLFDPSPEGVEAAAAVLKKITTVLEGSGENG